MPFQIIRNDITKVKADRSVNGVWLTKSVPVEYLKKIQKG